MKTITIAILTLLTIAVYGQNNQEKAYELGMKAIEKMEAGDIQESIKLLEESMELDPDNINYPYEIAYAHYLDKNYQKAIKVLKKLTKHDEVNDRVWQMLGNCYDLEGNAEKAIQIYEKGLKLFPNSGILYLERGNMELHKEAYKEAMGFYEKGIQVEPQFSSNYYWAAKIYMNSSEEVWGMIYGELFMNLERNTNRTSEISGLLYATYQNEITFSSDSSMSVSFCQQMSVNIDHLDKGEMKMPFCMVYEPTLLLSIAFVDTIDMNSLDQIRSTFVDNYYKMGHHDTHPNVLFDFQKTIKEKGHLEAYNHWVLMKGDENAFSSWHDQNKEKWDSFVDWFTENPIQINESNQFYSGQY